MNPNKICFITCVNDYDEYQEALLYIHSLNIPNGFKIETIDIRDAESMTKAYNAAMKHSDAKYKVYLHQDVFIINKNFIADSISIFQNNPDVGMIGLVGAKTIPPNGVWWESNDTYGKVYDSHTGMMQLVSFKEVEQLYETVMCVDGLLMITQYDVPWREDIFTGWHFYDVSQSMEFIKAGYRVVIPCQKVPWCIHDCGIVNVSNGYDEYRKVFLNTYSIINTKQPKVVLPQSLLDDASLAKWFTNRDELQFAGQLLSNSQTQFNLLVNQIESHFLNNNYDMAAKLTLKAAFYAHLHHPGFFVSPRLENILTEIGKKLDKSVNVTITDIPEKTKNKRNVLHVLSEGYATGGHTRLAERWIRKDKQSVHSVIMTLSNATTPPWLAAAAAQSGGWYYPLSDENISLCQRAKVLRAISRDWADVVVLHVHPHDPIPLMAFAVEAGPPVIFLNHADHAFWIGVSIADIVADLRPSASLLTLRRRRAAKSMLLPIPIEVPTATSSRELAKRKLGIDPGQIVLLSIAAEHKYVPCGEYNFYSVANEIITRHSNTQILIVGPSDAGQWQKLRLQTGGRVRALGIHKNLDIFHNAADLYLDSFSIGSLTASLEPGSKGIPVVGLVNPLAPLLSSEDISFKKINGDITDVKDYIARVDSLINDRLLRSSVGEKTRQFILEDHDLKWGEYLKSIYSMLPLTHQLQQLLDEEEELESSDVLWAYLQSISGLSKSMSC